ncbi:MAG: FAD-dependent oxidoreductase [Chthoniobacteraceae bacterium]
MRWLLLPLLLALSPIRAQEYGVLIYGATPGGIAAALAAAEGGEKVLLVEPTEHVGGMMTNGLTHPDFRTFEGITGAYRKFSALVEAHYRETYGADSPQVKDSLHGTQVEPRVNAAIFEKLLAAQPRIAVQTRWVLDRVKSSSNAEGDAPGKVRTLELALFADATNTLHQVGARMFIDGTYEGDLMAAAGVPYRVGREAGEEYAETLAPDEADTQLQGYNFRLTMTRDPANRVMPKAPEGYDRGDFVELLPLLADGRIKQVWGMSASALIKATIPPLPNGKFDINDMSHGLVRLSLPGENDDWADGSGGVASRELHSGVVAPFSRTALRDARARVWGAHRRWQIGLIYFLQNDAAVPEKFRAEAREMGWCRDEYPDSGHLPEQLYVREARRMVGSYVFTQKDTDAAPDDARSVLRRDAIAMGDYGPNCHGTAHEGSLFGGKHTGEFYKAVAPYQIPYGVMLAKDFENLLVPVAASSSHVGFCALRLEPIWMSLGEAAGHAAHLANAKKTTLDRVPVAELQAKLHASGAATIYVSDVLPGHPDFAAVQWWGAAGGLHGLAAAPGKPGERGKNIVGQYYEAFPYHAAALDEPLDAKTAARWQKLAGELGVAAFSLEPKMTRGDWLRKVWAARRP